MEINISNKKPLISVIINCFNGQKYLKDAIDSVINQSYKNWEIIFWDNGSTDNSASILKSYKDHRIKYFYSKKHSTLYEARNLAYKQSNGDFICFLDTDDYYLNNFFEKQLKLFEDGSIHFGCANHFYKDEKTKKFWVRFKKKQKEGYILSHLLLNYNIPLCTLFIRRNAISSLEFVFDDNYTYFGDFDLTVRLAANFKMARIHEAISVYRLHESNLSIQNYSTQIKELIHWQQKIQKIEKIKNNENFYNINNIISYKKIILALREKKFINSISLLYKLPWTIRKLRFISLIFLIFIFRIKFQNFRLN